MDGSDLIARYNGRLPRRSSDPTALHFHAGVGVWVYAAWLASLTQDAALSLYLYGLICMCCGCHNSVVRRDRPKRLYAQGLTREIGLLADDRLSHCAAVPGYAYVPSMKKRQSLAVTRRSGVSWYSGGPCTANFGLEYYACEDSAKGWPPRGKIAARVSGLCDGCYPLFC